MALDPQIKDMLDFIASTGAPALSDGTAEQARAAFDALTIGLRTPATVVQVKAVEDVTIPGPAGQVPARIYRPDGVEGPMPTLVFFHGGGFVIGSIETHDNDCRTLARDVEATVLSVGYRLAPEHRYPAALDDCLAATVWAGAHIGDLGADADRIAVGGDSAGGNLAAVVAQRCRDGQGPRLAAQMLFYPAVDFRADSDYPSRLDNAEGYFLTLADMGWFQGQYIEAGGDVTDPSLSPLLGDLAGLAPAAVVTAEFDPLRDEGNRYAQALTAAGVTVRHHQFDGLVHGFLDMGPMSAAAAHAVTTCSDDLRALLGEG